MRKNLTLYIFLIVGFMSCDLDSKLSGNKEKKNHDNVNGVLESAQVENIESRVYSESLNNKASISNISIGHAQKKEIKKEELIPSTNDEQKANEAIKNIESILGNSRFSDLIKDVCALKDGYVSIKVDFDNVMREIYNQKSSLMGDYKNNRDKISKLIQLQNELQIGVELDKLISNIDTAEVEIRSAAEFFDNAKKSLKEGIIKRLESRRNLSYASQLSREALAKAQSSLKNLESFSSKKIYAMGKKKEIEKLIEHAKTILANLN
ncbi:P12 family lipoprotein [Borreliella japonica]|uniref:P12 family lipoprotein n=1 Tax=Borreliella japonica TaxID=34095 RepID=UPI003AF1A658